MSITKDTIFKRLDRRLKKDERLALARSTDLSEYHFGLGLWIRNTWGENGEIRSLFSSGYNIADDKGNIVCITSFGLDEFSQNVLTEYQQYLREKYGIDMLTELLNCIIRLDVEGVKRLLGSAQYTADFVDERWDDDGDDFDDMELADGVEVGTEG